MIDKEYGEITLICDLCGDQVKDFETFGEAVDYKKAQGWKSRKNDRGEWEELCPECRSLRNF